MIKKNKYSHLVFLFVIIFCLAMFCGCSKAEVSLNRDGTGTMILTVAKEEGITSESLNETIGDVFSGVEALSGDKDRLSLISITENDGSFTVKISFKRIEKTSGLGSYTYSSYSEFLQEENNKFLLTKWAAGKYNSIQNYDQSTLTFSKTADKSLAFNPVSAASGEELDVENLVLENSEYASNKNNFMFSFFIAGIKGLSEVTFNFSGDIIVYAGKNLEVIDKNTVKITPVKTDAKVLKIVDGEAYQENEEVDCFAGYVIFKKSLNAFPIIAGTIGGIAVVILIVLGFALGWFKRIFRSKTFKRIISNYGLYIMMLPAFILLTVFCYKPMVGIVLAFKNFNVQDGIWGSEWIGLRNIIEVLTAPGTSFWMLARNTIILAALNFVFGFVCTILLAILFSYLKVGLFKKVVQTVSYFPYFISWVVISGISYLFLASDSGILNKLLATLGVSPISWYSSPQYWRGILTFTAIWKTVGYGTIVYLAGIASINPALYEAAYIDGAGRCTQLVKITLPELTPIIGIQMIFSLGNLVKDNFDQIYTMTTGNGSGGGNANLIETTEVIGTVVFKSIGSVASYGSATAMTLMQSVVSLFLVLSANIIVKKMDMEGLF